MTLKQRWRNVRPVVLAPFAYGLVRLLGMTVRLKTVGYDETLKLKEGCIYGGWHGRTFMGTILFRGLGVWTIISHSKDGDLQDSIIGKFGFRVIRGSTGRGGVRALRESIEALQDGGRLAFTPDGPRGPSGVVQPGVMAMARKSGAWLVPGGSSANRRWIAPTWDRFLVPKPFSRGVVVFGEPVKVPPNASEAEVEAIRVAFEAALHAAESEAERLCGHISAT